MAYRQKMSETVLPAFKRISELKNYPSLTRDYESMDSCGEYITAIKCDSCHTKHFSGFYRCKVRWCIPCSRLKVLAWLARLVPVVLGWISEGGRVAMLNFTVKDTAVLSDGVRLLEESFRRVYNQDSRIRQRWKDRFPGGVRSLEIKIGKGSGLWHPHLHCLVLQSSLGRDFEWLRDAWELATWTASGRDYREFIDLSREEKDVVKLGSVWIKPVSKRGLIKSVVETLKYIIKPSDGLFCSTGDALLLEAWEVLKGKRQINTWGVLRGLAKDVEEDIENLDEKKLADFICRVCGCTKGELVRLVYEDVKETWLFDAP